MTTEDQLEHPTEGMDKGASQVSDSDAWMDRDAIQRDKKRQKMMSFMGLIWALSLGSKSELAYSVRFQRVHNQVISHHLLDAIFSLNSFFKLFSQWHIIS